MEPEVKPLEPSTAPTPPPAIPATDTVPAPVAAPVPAPAAVSSPSPVPAPVPAKSKFNLFDFSAPTTEDEAWDKLRRAAYAGLLYAGVSAAISLYAFSVIDAEEIAGLQGYVTLARFFTIAYYAIPVLGAVFILKKRPGGMIAVGIPFIISFAGAILQMAVLTALVYLVLFALIFQGMMAWRTLRDWKRTAAVAPAQ